MTKAEYIDLIRGIVDPSGRNPRYRPQFVEACIEMVYNQFTYNLTEDKYIDFDFLTKEYTSQTVTLDATTDRYYTLLPAPLVPLKIPSEAVRHVGSNQDVSCDFMPMRETDWELFSTLLSHSNDTTIGYIARYDRIWFNESMSSSIANAGVRLVLAVPFRSFTYDEHVNLPVGGVELVTNAINMLNGVQPMDLKNNNK